MIDVIRAILRKIGIILEDVTIRRLDKDYGNGIVLPTDDWIMLFEYRDFTITIELNKVRSIDSWMTLIKQHNEDMMVSHRVELAELSPQELYKIIEEFITKKGGEN